MPLACEIRLLLVVTLEMKAALIVPHAKRGGGPSLLFEPYFNMLNFEFCVGMFSTCEGLGSASWLREQNRYGSAAVGEPGLPARFLTDDHA